ncbi:MAG: DNA methylase [Planctomycetota bacterium]|nr:MAG: DNA methylase [Planctomycetota bacterium]
MAKNSKQPGLNYGQNDTTAQGPVECLGQTFPNDEARRAHFTDLLREKLKDPAFRKIEGFPNGNDEAIIALSDPPYFTACPNPFLNDFVRVYGKRYDAATDTYSRKPFTADVTEGKNDPIYNIHSYHTKVPHKAIMRYIIHYTEPGDIVFDGFCGTGMTGIAAALCGERASTRTVHDEEAHSIGNRHAVLVDLSPIATFIANGILSEFSVAQFVDIAYEICERVENEYGRFYRTNHSGWKVRERKTAAHKQYSRPDTQGQIEFVLTSDIMRCPECSHEFSFYSVAVDEEKDELRDTITCPGCSSVLDESKIERVEHTIFDPVLGRPITQSKTEPVLINYSVGTTRYEKLPDDSDLQLTRDAWSSLSVLHIPNVELIEGKETLRNVPIGITHLHHFFAPREHLIVAALLREISQVEDVTIRNAVLFALTATLPYASRMRRFRADRKGGGPLSGTLYVSSLTTPPNVLQSFRRSVETIAGSLTPQIRNARQSAISTQSSSQVSGLPDECVDYIFTDPPFGSNFDYSELNFFWEPFLAVTTNQKPEAIVSSSQGKSIDSYRSLMTQSFTECYRVLKPGRWMTVEFSNTKAAVWNAIQTALEHAGFVIANVSTLDKKQRGFKALMTPTAVKQDLIITVYKPTSAIEERIKMESGTVNGAWEFIRQHLRQLPVFVSQHGCGEIVTERLRHMLYDRMVSFHVQRSVAVPISAGEFYASLAEMFSERDGMYFLPEQISEYERSRMEVKKFEQLQLFVNDEKSAIQWVRSQLVRSPMKYQDLSPLYMMEAQRVWEKHEQPLELRTILEESFVEEQDGTWRIPNPKMEADLEQIRHRALLKEFQSYLDTKGKLKIVRTEALRAGFKESYQKKDFKSIVQMAKRVPETVIHEDPSLLMYFDNASLMVGE